MSQPLPNPLRDVHRQAEAEFQNWDQVEIVQTFGEPQAEYAAIHKSAGLMDLPQRGVIELTGKDRLAFLNNLLTSQIWNKPAKTGLEEGRGVYAFMLNLRGRVVADMNVLELGDRTWIEVESRLARPLAQVLDKYLFAEQVKITPRVGELHEIALHGPRAGEVLGLSIDTPLKCMNAKVMDVDAVVWREDPAGVPGYHVVVPAESARTVWMNLIATFGTDREAAKRLLRPVGWAAFNSTRIEAGTPIFAIDFDGAPLASALPGKKDEGADSGVGALPAETGLFEKAVSVTKGCYLGQEIVARMHARAQVARKVVGIRMDDDALPVAGTEVFDDQQGSVVGVITSSTVAPVLSNAALCLGMIKRSHFATGTPLKIPAEGAIRSAKIVELPFGALSPSPSGRGPG